MGSKTKTLGNKAESVILSEFIKHNIPTSIPFGDNEKYDLVIEIDGNFYSVQVKSGSYKNGIISIDLRHRIGVKRIKYETYEGKVDLIAVWCEDLNRSFILPMIEFGKNTCVRLRINKPKNNSCVTKINWADEYEFGKVILRVGEVISRCPHKSEIGGVSPSPATINRCLYQEHYTGNSKLA